LVPVGIPVKRLLKNFTRMSLKQAALKKRGGFRMADGIGLIIITSTFLSILKDFKIF
jgi:hypothetical protein